MQNRASFNMSPVENMSFFQKEIVAGVYLSSYPKILKTEAEYSTALAKVESLMDANPGSKQEEQLELWSWLVERYEQEHHPIDFPDPIEAIRFRMEQEGLRQKDLAKYFPGKNRVSEVLNHKRPLSLGMIRSLHNGLGIPAHVLLQECTA